MFRGENCKIFVSTGYDNCLTGVKTNGLYVFSVSIIISPELNVSVHDSDKTVLWHLRLSHVGETGLRKLSQLGCLGSDNISKLDFCEICILGKTTKPSYKLGIHRSVRVYWTIYILIFGGQLELNLQLENTIFLLSLLIIVEECGFTSCQIRMKLLNYLRSGG